MKITATCFAWRSEAEWEALCVDFDLAAHGKSLEEVRREMQDAIDSYISYVSELPEPERTRLLKRKTPLVLRFKLKLLCIAYDLLNLLRVRPAHRCAFKPAVELNAA